MNQVQCIHCGRQIVFAKRTDTRENMALEKIYPYEIKFDPLIGWAALAVEPVDGEPLYAAHVRLCQRKETPA